MTEQARAQETELVRPLDEHNRALVSNVHPPDWVNPEPADKYNLVVIGAGTAGLVTAAGAAGLGAKVALVERHLMGGDCLNVGCVPSKCLIASSRFVGDARTANDLGVRVPRGIRVDFPAVMKRMREIRSRISKQDSARRFKELGVDVFIGDGKFTGRDTVEVGGKTLRFRRAVIATGARAARLPIPGLEEAGFLTNENVFWLTKLPRRLAVIGGGPIGCELAQAFRRMGSEVTMFNDIHKLLPREDADAAEIVQNRFLAEGIKLVQNCRITKVEKSGDGKRITHECGGKTHRVVVDEILSAVGRVPNTDGLGLEAAGVKFGGFGVEVDDRLRTTNLAIYAAGDVCMKYKFTHAADFAARTVIQNALFMGRKKLSALTVPWCTYTDPEVAHVGMYEKDARDKGIEVDTYTKSFADIDRALADGEEEGFVKVHVRRGTDEILGATIVARHAGEMIGELCLAVTHGIGLKKIAGVIHPYPTQAEAIRKLGDDYNRTRLTEKVKKIFRKWLSWTR